MGVFKDIAAKAPAPNDKTFEAVVVVAWALVVTAGQAILHGVKKVDTAGAVKKGLEVVEALDTLEM